MEEAEDVPTIFFSWQVDRETRSGRNFIERALERATSSIGRDMSIEDAIRDLKIDRDTKGVAGSPPIVDTIFKKIDDAAVFVPDLTFVGERPDGRPTPNPNVLIEYGWALKSRGHGRVVPVMNTAYGEPTAEAMPFDMRHLRNPITYHCPADLDDSSRRAVREQLSKDIESAIRAVLDSDEPQPSEPRKFIEKQLADGKGRFRAAGDPLGLLRNFSGAPSKVQLAEGPICWFRMMPTIDPGRKWSVAELEKSMNAPLVLPVSRGWHGLDYLHGADGYGCFAPLEDRTCAMAVVFAFTTGEVWSIDAYWLRPLSDGRKLVPVYAEADFRLALVDYASLLQRLGVDHPYKWIIGMEGLKGRLLYTPTRPGYQKFFSTHDGECLVDEVIESGLYSPGDPPGSTLKPFFVRLYESCGLARQDWQNQ
jgi:hypothetical protein